MGHVVRNREAFFPASYSSITIVTHCQFVPHYLSLDQHVLKQVAEERTEQLIAAMLMDVDGLVWNRIGEVWLMK